MAKTYFEYPGDGVRTVYPVSFALGYLQQQDVYVFVGTDPTVQVNYSWQDSASIELDAAPAIGTTLTIRRITERDVAINDYQNGAVLEEKELDNSFAQGLMLAEETEDGFATEVIQQQDMDFDGKDILRVNALNAATVVLGGDDLQGKLNAITAYAVGQSDLSLAYANASEESSVTSSGYANDAEAQKITATNEAIAAALSAAASAASAVDSEASADASEVSRLASEAVLSLVASQPGYTPANFVDYGYITEISETTDDYGSI
jgi:hypothetical protein